MTVVEKMASLTGRLFLQDPNDNSMLDMLIGYSCIQIRILLLLLWSGDEPSLIRHLCNLPGFTLHAHVQAARTCLTLSLAPSNRFD